jgi:tripartite-type tricarboxylate transporter receptor subunit TctC
MKLLINLSVAIIAFFSSGIWAQKPFDPTVRPIEVVIPFAPGGASHNLSLLVTQIFKDHGWQSMVSPKPGGNQTIAANYVAAAKPDGHTLFQTGKGSTVMNMAYPDDTMKYNENSWEHITLLNRSDLGLVVNADSPIKNYEQLKFYVRANPDKFNIAFWNPIMAKIFEEWARKEGLPPPTIINYKGSVPALTDVIGGQVLMAFDNVGWGAPMLPYVESKKLRVLALMDGNISKIGRKWLEENKSIVDIGRLHPELRTGVFIGLSAPAGTPRDVVNEINNLLRKAVNDPRYQDRLKDIDGWGTTPAEYTNFIRSDLENTRKLKARTK